MPATEPESDHDTLASDGPLATLFSGPARTRIIETFVENRSRELNVSDIARESDTARSTVYRHLDQLEALGLIERVPTGTNERYTLDTDSDIAHFLYKLEGVTLKKLLKLDDRSE